MSNAEILQLVAGLIGAVASIIAAAETGLVKRLERAGATSPEQAVELPGLMRVTRWRLARLMAAGAIAAAGPDRYYLRSEEYRGLCRQRVRRALPVALLLVVVAVVAAVLSR